MPDIPFVDRTTELRFLQDRLAHACDHSPGLVLISGLAGTGKTALIRHFTTILSDPITVAEGRGWDNRGASSLHALREIVDQLPCPPDAFDPAVRLFLDNPSGNSAASLSLDNLFPPLAAFFHQLARRQPLCLFFDDLQWVDEATFEYLDFAFRQCQQAPILWIGAYRSEESDSLSSLLKRRAAWHRTERFAELALGPLSRPAVDELTHRSLPGCQEQTVEEIWQRSEGLALLTVEEIRARWDGRQDAPAGQALIADHLDRLSDPQRQLLAVAAIIGERFAVEPLAAVLEQDGLEVTRQLETLRVSQGLLEEDGDRYRFAHSRYREALLEGMSQALQRQLHTRLGAQGNILTVADRTYHLVHGGDVEQGIKGLLAEGDQVRNRSDWRNALRYYMEALRLVQSRPLDDRTLYLSVFQRIGDLHQFSAGQDLIARSYYEAARSWVTTTREQALLLCRIAYTYRGESPVRLQLLEEAVQLIPQIEDPQVKDWLRFLRAKYDTATLPANQPQIRQLVTRLRPLPDLSYQWLSDAMSRLAQFAGEKGNPLKFERQVEQVKTWWPEAVLVPDFYRCQAEFYSARFELEKSRELLRLMRWMDTRRGHVPAVIDSFRTELLLELGIGAYEKVRSLITDFLDDVLEPDPRWRIYQLMCATWPFDRTPEGLSWARKYLEGIAAFFLEFPTDGGHLRSLPAELGIVERIFREEHRAAEFREHIDTLRDRLKTAGYQTDISWYLTDPIDLPELDSIADLTEWNRGEKGDVVLENGTVQCLCATQVSLTSALPRLSRQVSADFTLQATLPSGAQVRESIDLGRQQFAAAQKLPVACGTGGLCAIWDRHNFLQFSAHAGEPDEVLFAVVREGKRPSLAGRGLLEDGPINLRLERQGTTFHAYAANEEKSWFLVGNIDLPHWDQVEIGVYGGGATYLLDGRHVEQMETRLRDIHFVQSPPRPTAIEPTYNLYELPDPIYVPGLPGFVAADPTLRKTIDQARRAGSSSLAALIQGETGTGKELIAHAIHQLGDRAGGPFIPVNCAAIPPDLLESELFGHVRGAYTGAYESRGGLFESADQGILFLDEIGDATPAFQARLLRAIEEQAVRRVGDQQLRPIDVRVVAATNRDLRQAMVEGQFRRDFFYRLAGVEIHVPPLRERRSDIPHLITHTLWKWSRRRGQDYPTITTRAMQLLIDSDWPGNVRELIHVVENAAEEATGKPITPSHLLLHASAFTHQLLPPDQDERQQIIAALQATNGNVKAAAHRLGIHRNTLHRRLRKLGLK